MGDFTPRPYQLEASQAVVGEWYHGRSTALIMATGTGKTATAVYTVKQHAEYMRQPRVLWLTHRENLVDQTIGAVKWAWPGCKVGAVQGSRNDVTARFVVATAQTLVSDKRLAKVMQHGRFTHLVIDEFHNGHFFPDRYRGDVVSKVRRANPGVHILGLTATPVKANGEDARWLVDSVAYEIDIQRAVDEIKCLVPPVGKEYTVPVSLAGVKVRGGDYTDAQLSVMDAENVYEIIFRKWQEQAGGRQTIGFVVSIEMAEGLAQYFRRRGVMALPYHSKLKKRQKEMILWGYRKGHVKVAINPASLIEGADFPATSCIIMARPTQSQGLFTQCVGRGLRLADGKIDCVVLNFAPKDGQSLVTTNVIYDPAKRREFSVLRRGGSVIDAQGEKNAENAAMGQNEAFQVNPDDLQAAIADFYTRFELRTGRSPGQYSLKAEPYIHHEPTASPPTPPPLAQAAPSGVREWLGRILSS